MRAAIYARMSTDKQNDRSPDDQVAVCRRFAKAQNWEVVEDLVEREPGISGESRHNRPGLLSLFARIAEWDVLLCWDSSRLSRNSEDIGWIRNRLREHRRTGYEASTGNELSGIAARFMGVVNEEALVKLRADTQRGLRCRAEAGLSTGGLAYGYRSEPVARDAHGAPVESAGWRIEIDADEAALVRRLFASYLAGQGLREIAHALNAEGIRPPRPRALAKKRPSWSPSAIRAMLLNPLYAGERVFNKTNWIKTLKPDPDRPGESRVVRVRHERPESEWVREARPDLAVVDRATFDALQAEMQRRQRTSPYVREATGTFAGTFGSRLDGRKHRGPARYPLSGLLECGACGGPVHVLSRDYGCGWHRDRGPEVCASALRVPRPALEARVLGALHERILVPEVIARAAWHALQGVRAELAPERVDAANTARVVEIDADLDVLRRMAARPGLAGQTVPLIAALEAERATLQKPANAMIDPSLDLAALLPAIDAQVRDLRTAFGGAPDECRAALHALLGERRLRVLADSEHHFRVEGTLVLALEAVRKGRTARPDERAVRLGGSGGGI